MKSANPIPRNVGLQLLAAQIKRANPIPRNMGLKLLWNQSRLVNWDARNVQLNLISQIRTKDLIRTKNLRYRI